MTRLGSLSLGAAAAAVVAVSLYLWMELRQSHPLVAAESISLSPSATGEQPLTASPSPAFDANALVDEIVEVEAPSREAESAPMIALNLPPLTQQITVNWEDNQRRRTYRDLLKLMHLSPVEEEQFLALLAARCDGETEADDQAERETEGALQRLLAGHWPQFVAYEQEMEERIYVMQCDEVMAAHDVQLAPEQRRQLVSMMAQTRRSVGVQRTDQPEAWMQTERIFQATVLGNAANILKPEQLAAFRLALRQQLEASQLALQLASDVSPGVTAGAAVLPMPLR
jgi:hypothetical protein